jgi:hypothetical protein
MTNIPTVPSFNFVSRYRFSPGDEVTLQCGSVGVIQEVLQANHYRILKTATGEPVVEHDFSLVGKSKHKHPAASLPHPAARSAAAPWRGAERRRP